MKLFYPFTKWLICFTVLLFGASATFAQSPATILEEWPFTVDASDSAVATGVTATSPTLAHLFLSTVSSVTAAYTPTLGEALSPNSITPGDGHWNHSSASSSAAASNGNGKYIADTVYQEFLVVAASTYTVTVDSFYLYAGFISSTSTATFMGVWSTSHFRTDSTNIAGYSFQSSPTLLDVGILPQYTVGIAATAANHYGVALNTSGGVVLNPGDTLTMRLYFSCGSSSGGRYACVKDVIAAGSVLSATPPCISEPGAFTSSSVTVCQGTTGVVYTVPNDPTATSYTWTYSGTGASFTSTTNSVTIDYSSSATSGTLSVVANAICGSSAPETLAITVGTPPAPGTISGPGIVCTGSTITLTDAGSSGTGRWVSSDPATASVNSFGAVSGILSGSVAITYSVTNGCGSNSTSSVVNVNGTIPSIIAGTGASICAGSSATLTATGGTTYSWAPSTGLTVTTGSGISADPSGTITYTVTGTTAGCSNTATETITVNSIPSIITGSAASICAGSSATLTATGGTDYSWAPSTGLTVTTGASVSADPSSTTTYTVTGTTAGCSNTATETITVNSSVPLTASVAYSGTTYTLTTNATSYTVYWIVNYGLGAVLVSTPTWSYTVAPGTTDTIGAVVIPLTGCFSPDTAISDTLYVTAPPLSVNTITGAAGISVYPNPFTDNFIVSGCGEGDVVSISNLLGREVVRYTCKGNNGAEVVPVGSLVPAVYIMRILAKNGEQLSVQKLTKE